MTRWYRLDRVEAKFFSSAPYLFQCQKPFAATPERVWQELIFDASAAAWGRMITQVSWTSAPPHGVGATRESVALGARARSRYIRWDENIGYSMYVYESTAPVFQRYAEDFVLEPNAGGTLFTFTVAIEPKPGFSLAFKAISPLLGVYLRSIAADGQRYFAEVG